MPTFDYRCQACGTVYEVFHKVREVVEDVVCPSCHSTAYQRLMSAPMVQTAGMESGSDSTCSTGSCCGGSCGLE